MRCPYCNSSKTYVAGTIHIDTSVKRYRKCRDCHKSYVTVENPVALKRGRPKKMYCKWCGRELKNWYLTYKDMHFCRYNNDSCLKNYLFEEHDKEITEDRDDNSEYSMREVCENDGIQDKTV